MPFRLCSLEAHAQFSRAQMLLFGVLLREQALRAFHLLAMRRQTLLHKFGASAREDFLALRGEDQFLYALGGHGGAWVVEAFQPEPCLVLDG